MIVSPFALLPVATGLGGAIYAGVAVLGGAVFTWHALRVFLSRAGEVDAPQDIGRAKTLFGISILYLFALFAALMAEHVLPLHFPLNGGA
jgi:protoheme IX farnesyltransferase